MPIYEVCIRVNDAAGATADWKDGMPVKYKKRDDPAVVTPWGLRQLGGKLRVLVVNLDPTIETQVLAWLDEQVPLGSNTGKRKTRVIEYWNKKNGLTDTQIATMRDPSIVPDVRYDLTALDLTKANIRQQLIVNA